MAPRKIEALVLALALLGPALRADPGAGRAAFLKAVQDLRSGRMQAACDGLKTALAEDPSSVEARFYLGQSLYFLGRLDESEAQFEAVAAAEPAMPATHYYLGRVAFDRGRWADAFGQLRQADLLDGSLPMVHYYLGLVYEANAQPDIAALEFEKAVELEPGLALAGYNLAWIRWHHFKRAVAARAAAAQALAGHPDAALRRKIMALMGSLDSR